MSTYRQPVLYTLSQDDADYIRAQRENSGVGGNPAGAGTVYPAFIVNLWSPTYANLTVFLDGRDTFWATSKQRGNSPGTWSTGTETEPAPAADGQL